MQDIKAQLEKLRSEAINSAQISDNATDPEKRKLNGWQIISMF
jgi:hypothetical protein